MLEAVPYSTVNMLFACAIWDSETHVSAWAAKGEARVTYLLTRRQDERDTRGAGTSRMRQHVEQLSVSPDLVNEYGMMRYVS